MHWLLLELTVLLGALAAFITALEIGYRLGVARQAKADEPDKTHAHTLHGAVLGLLALLLGFTFAMAVSRYEHRKALIVDQANAIGTAELRARLLPGPVASSARTLLREYLDTRLQYNAAGVDLALLNAADSHAARIEDQLWEIARQAITADPRSQPASLFLQSMNEVIDLREKRRFALDDQVPNEVVFLLFAVSAAALGLVSYGCGLTGRRRPLANFTFALLIAMVLVIILDIDRPRQGFVQTRDDSLIRLQQALTTP